MTAVATRQAIDRLEVVLARVGHPLPAAEPDGLSDDEIDELVSALDVRLPEQVRELWRWRDGWAGPHFMLFNLPFLPLEIAVQSWHLHVDAFEHYRSDPGSVLRPSLFPVFAQGFEVVSADTTAALGEDAPLVYWPIDDPGSTIADPQAHTIASVPGMLDQASGLLERGVFTWVDESWMLPTNPDAEGRYWAF